MYITRFRYIYNVAVAEITACDIMPMVVTIHIRVAGTRRIFVYYTRCISYQEGVV